MFGRFPNKRNKFLVCLTMLLWLLPFRSEGALLKQEITLQGSTLELRGKGILIYAVFFEVYQAGLYLPANVTSEKVLSDVPKRLEIHYNYKIKAQEIISAAQKALAKNWNPEILKAEKEKLDLINSAFVDVKPGDSYALTYLPTKGTELSLNSVPQINIKGARFAALMFSIWLGKNPLDQNLKQALLGYD
jgi:hypothetical protein